MRRKKPRNQRSLGVRSAWLGSTSGAKEQELASLEAKEFMFRVLPPAQADLRERSSLGEWTAQAGAGASVLCFTDNGISGA